MTRVLASVETIRPAADQRLQGAVRLAVAGLPGRARRQLWVAASGGVVTLAGKTESFYEKQLLLSAIRHIPGVQKIVDEVAVASD